MISGGSVTIVVLPPERENELLSLAQEWTAAWLIRSAIWIKASDLLPDPVFPEAPPLVHGYVMGRNGAVKVPLFHELSRREYSLLRFVTVRSVEGGEAYNELQDETVRSLEEHLRLSKPHQTNAQFVNLVFAPTRHSGASAHHVVERGWNVNILVSPEDRRTASSFDAFTRHSSPKEWTGFVLAHAVTAAGLWSTLESGPYDEVEFDGYMEGTHVQRVVVRGVLTGALVVNVGRQALELASQDDNPLADPLIAIGEQDLRVMSEEEETKAITDLIRVTLQLSGAQLSYKPVADPPTLPPRKLGFFAQVRDISEFGVDKIRDTPEWFARLFKGKASRKATAEFHGEGSDTRVDAGGILSREDADLTDAVAELDQQRELMLAKFDEPITARRHDVDGPLFESVRQAGFALLDGSPLPEGHAMRTVWAPEERAPVVRSITSIVPDWKDSWTASDAVQADLGSFARLQGKPSHWLDVDFTHAWRDELGRRVSRLGEREGMLRQRLGAARLERQVISEDLEELSARADALRDEVRWLSEDLAEHEEHAREESGSASEPQSTQSVWSALPKSVGEDAATDLLSPVPGSLSSQKIDLASDAPSDTPADTDSAEEPAAPTVRGEIRQQAHDPVVQRLRDELKQRSEELKEAEREEQAKMRSLQRVVARQERNQEALRVLDEQVARLATAAEDLREWTAARSKSFSWQLLERLSSEQQEARKDLGDLREALKTPITVKVERPSTLQRRFMVRGMAAFGVILLVWLLILFLKSNFPDLEQIAPAVNPVAWPIWVSGLVALITFLLLWVLFLIGYYRETSKRRQALRQIAAHVEYLGTAVVEMRQEMQRLEALHLQVPDYLKYLSEVLHRPWQLPELATLLQPGQQEGETPEGVLFGASRPDSTTLPSLMRLAEPPLGAGGDKEAALVRDAVRALMHRGWRYGALCQLLQSAEQSQALPTGTFDVSRVDRDGRIRNAVLKALDTSDARLRAGREQLRGLARRIHLQVMDEIHPSVQELVEDPLAGLELEEDILAEGDWRIKEWDDFLAEAVGPASEWSTAAFSLDGLSQGVPEVVSTAYGPERLAESVDSQVSFISVRDKSVRPVELVVRVDRSPASLGPVRFRLFNGVASGTPTDVNEVPGTAIDDSRVAVGWDRSTSVASPDARDSGASLGYSDSESLA